VLDPRGHVTKEAFAKTLLFANQAGLSLASEPIIRSSRAALLRKRSTLADRACCGAFPPLSGHGT
jgi:hypothetical protein